ncbi:MAG: RluA family pseudouridine synthase, partial [Casimicrobiaceae bacterium]
MRLSVPPELAELRLDAALARLLPEHSRSRLSEWLALGHILVDGLQLPGKTRLAGGETITVDLPEVRPNAQDAPEDIPLDILHEDEHLLVLDKPPGLVVHPGAGNPDGTLLNALLHHAPQLADIPRAGTVHRLDRDTSGVMMVAKTLAAQTALVRQLQSRTASREYLALVDGILARPGTVDAAIGRHPRDRTRMAVVVGSSGKPAVTHYRPRERFDGPGMAGRNATLVECRLETGRTHQIR